MKRYLSKILLFTAIVFIVDICVGTVGDYLQTHAKSGMTKRTNDLAMKDNHDVVIFGSSRTHHHYDTPFLSDTLGLDVYNAGYDGNGIVLANGLFYLILERYHPKLVIFDVEPAFDINVYVNDNHHIRYLSYLRPYYHHKAIGNIFRDVSCEEWYKVHSGLIRYNSKIVIMCMDNLNTRSIQVNGYVPLEGIYGKTPEAIDNANGEIDDFKLHYVEMLINTAQNHQVPIVFMASPKLGAVDSKVMQPIKRICNKKGVRFLDYYSAKEYQNPEYYKDPMHLNAVGARIFSKKIAEIINCCVDISI